MFPAYTCKQSKLALIQYLLFSYGDVFLTVLCCGKLLGCHKELLGESLQKPAVSYYY